MDNDWQERVRRLLEKVIEESAISRDQLARDAGLSRDVLYAWMRGLRRARPESLAKLAQGLEYRAEVLLRLAGETRDVVERETPKQEKYEG